MKTVKTILSIAVLALFVGAALTAPARAGDIAAAALLQRIEKLETEIADLKALLKAPAEKSAADAPIAIGGKAFIAYSFDTDGMDRSDNEFTVDRWYFTSKKTIGDKMSAVMTLNVASSPDSTKTKFNTYIKYAYVQMDEVMPGGGLTLGQQEGSWVGNEEKAWRYRSIRKILADDKGLLGSSDFGVGLKGSLNDKTTEYHLLVANGEGYGAREEAANPNAKDVSLRLSQRLGSAAPRLSLFGGAGSAGGVKSNRFAAMLDQQIDAFSYAASFVRGVNGATRKQGLSLSGNYDFTGSPWSVFARFDRYDPDRSAQSDMQTLFLGGAAYRFNKNARLILSHQTDKNDALKGSAVADEKDASLKAVMEINY